MRRTLIAAASILVVGGMVACTLESSVPQVEENPVVPEPMGDGDGGTKPKKDGSAGEGGGGDTCPYTGTPIDVSPFAKCRDTGRCIPEALIPADQKGRLAGCTTTDNAG